MKNTNYLNWDEYFMGIALLSAKRSKDPNTCVGACIVSQENRILSVGYNGMPRGCSDDEYPWEREGNDLETKYFYVCHAELNAILNYTGTKMSAPRPSSRPASPRSFTRATNTTSPPRTSPPSACLPPQA